MKFQHNLLAVSLFTAASLAHAQSSVQLFGVVDMGLQYVKSSGAGSLTSLNADGNNSSRFGLRGSEDLGAGLHTSFWLEAGFSPDTGVVGPTSTNNSDSVSGLFGRRATVSLSGSWGELRLGRDSVPSFRNFLSAAAHPFGPNGVGNVGQLFYPVNTGGTVVRTNVRSSNALGYILPAGLGGAYGEAMYGLGEQATNAPGNSAKNGNYAGARIGYAAGPMNLAVATGKTNYYTGDFEQSNMAGTYQLGPAKLMYMWGRNKVGTTRTTTNMLGTQYTIGQGEVRFAYTDVKARGAANDADQWTLGYVHNLSKRTALYATYSRVRNKDGGKAFKVGNGLGVTTAGGASDGADVGIRHNF